MKFNRREGYLFGAGLLALLGLVKLLFNTLSTLPQPETQQPRLSKATDLPKTAMRLNDLRFTVDRNRRSVCAFSLETGKKVWESTGEERFIIPGAAFPIDLSPDGELWVANVGRKRLEQLDPQTGRFLASWQPTKPFAGCCNPVRFAVLARGRFVTMEKGSRQICIYLPSGDLEKIFTGELSVSEYDYHLHHNDDTVFLSDLHSTQQWEVPYNDSP